MSKQIEVKLLSGPRYPIGTLFCIWHASRCNDEIPTPREIEILYQAAGLREFLISRNDNTEFYSRSTAMMLGFEGTAEGILAAGKLVKDTVTKLLTEAIPVLENIHYTFLIENLPYSTHLQMVRHRIGTKVGDRIGADIVPDLADSTFWMQSLRMLDVSRFSYDENYVIPQSIYDTTNPCTIDTYREIMEQIQDAYELLIIDGVPAEDARQILPQGITTRGTWTLNLKALTHIIGKRSCWVSQIGTWGQIIEGMVDAISAEYPIFRLLVNPPCIRGENEWLGCPFQLMNEERIQGKDPFPPCPLYLSHHENEATRAADIVVDPTWYYDRGYASKLVWSTSNNDQQNQMMEKNRAAFGSLWKRNVDTGERI